MRPSLTSGQPLNGFYSPVTRTLYANGRTYSVAAGGTVDVLYADGLAIQSDEAVKMMITGAPADRPVNFSWPPRSAY